MKRARIIAKGEVQGVGYRGVVFRIARELKIAGFVENIRPYDVRIIAEGEKENVEMLTVNPGNCTGKSALPVILTVLLLILTPFTITIGSGAVTELKVTPLVVEPGECVQ